MKFLFISYDGLTDPLGQSQILPYIIGLKQKGLDYTILSVDKKKAFKENFKQIRQQLNEIDIPWTAIPYTKKPAFLSTVFDVFQLRKKIKKQIKENDITHLHCRSYVAMYAAFPLARRFNLKIIFDIRGFWIDERIEGGIWSISNPFIKLLVDYLKRKERLWFEESDLIISLTENGKSQITRLYPKVESNKIHVIPCCADEKHFNPNLISSEQKLELKEELGLREEEKILGYVGSIGTWYLCDEMFQTFDLLKSKGLVDKFLIITKEEEKTLYQMALKNKVQQQDIIIKSGERRNVPKLLNIINLGIFFIKPSFSKTASSPTKLGELLLMGKAVICNIGVGDLNDYFEKHKVGYCIDVADRNSINSDQVEGLMKSDPSEIRNIALVDFSLRTGIDKYHTAISSII